MNNTLKFFHVCLLALGMTFFANQRLSAQIQVGSHLFGASLDGDFMSFSSASNINVSLNSDFQYAYFVRDGLAVGAIMPLSYSAGQIIDPIFRFVEVGIGPYLQWYPGKQDRMVKCFVLASTDLRYIHRTGLLPGANFFELNWLHWTNRVGGGLNAFITPNVALTGTTSFFYILRLNDGPQPESAALSFNFGVQVFLPPRQ